jgi:hypothetical protein
LQYNTNQLLEFHQKGASSCRESSLWTEPEQNGPG